MSATVQLTEFNQALTEYMRHTRRGLAEVVNKKTTSILLNAAKMAPKGNKAAIKSLEDSMEWWPKFINKVLRDSGYTLKFRRMAKGADAQASWVDPSTGKVHKGRKRMSIYRAAGRSNADKRRISKSIIRRRTKTINYMKSLFLNAAAKFNPTVRMSAYSTFRRGWDIKAAPATERDIQATLSIPITTENRPWSYSSVWGNEQSNKERKYSVALKVLQQAVANEAASMYEYINRKLAEAAARHSARAA